MWEGGKCVPPPPGGEILFAQVSVTKRDLDAANIFVSKPKRDFDAASMADDLLERAARRPAATASCLQLDALPPRHPPINRSGFARDRPGLGRSVTCNSASAMLLSNHSQRPAAGSIPAQADARRGLLHERALVHHQGLEEVRRACCHCILLP